MAKVVMYGSVSVDGLVADENDQPGPPFDWLSSGDVPLDESGELKVSQTSYDYIRPYWDQIGATVVGRHVFDMTDGWDGEPPAGIDHVVVVTHRPEPEGWDPEAPFHFVARVEAAVAKAQGLAGDRLVEVAAGDVGGQVLAAGLIDEVRMDVVPVVFGSGKRYFGSVHAQHLLEDPDVLVAVDVPPPGGPDRGTGADGAEQDGDCCGVHACCWARTVSWSGLVAVVADGAVRGQVHAYRTMRARTISSSATPRP